MKALETDKTLRIYSVINKIRDYTIEGLSWFYGFLFAQLVVSRTVKTQQHTDLLA